MGEKTEMCLENMVIRARSFGGLKEKKVSTSKEKNIIENKVKYKRLERFPEKI